MDALFKLYSIVILTALFFSCKKEGENPAEKEVVVEDFRTRYTGQFNCLVERYGYNSETGSSYDYQFDDTIDIRLHSSIHSAVVWQDKERTSQMVYIVNDTTSTGYDEDFKFFEREPELRDSLYFMIYQVSPAYYDRTTYQCQRFLE